MKPKKLTLKARAAAAGVTEKIFRSWKRQGAPIHDGRAMAEWRLARELNRKQRDPEIRLVNHHFLSSWRQLDEIGAKNRGLLSLMRRHTQNLRPDQQSRLRAYLEKNPILEAIYHFKQKLCRLLLIKRQTARQCRRLIPLFLEAIQQLRTTGLAPLQTLGATLASWQAEVACMWRFARNNAITEGFHTKMEMISRRAFGFRNFQNYRLRVTALCA
ncbi:MAG: transposase [Verrucomicrobiae bacterium]|nr:transposase [Verrucomicrobiae bacterium]